MKNADFAKEKRFIEYCEAVNIKPTPRQASKFQNRKGLAYNTARRILAEQRNEQNI